MTEDTRKVFLLDRCDIHQLYQTATVTEIVLLAFYFYSKFH